MATTVFDTHAAVKELQDSGFHEEGASAVVKVVQKAQEELVTKADLAHLGVELKGDVTQLRGDIAQLRGDMTRFATKEDLLQLRGDFHRALWIQSGSIFALLVAVLVSSRFL